MAIKGSLKEASLADVFQLLALGGKTGCLSVTDRSNFGQIYFDAGRITYARIVNRRDRLGDMLLHSGLISHQQLQQVLDRQAQEPEKRLGELLVEAGAIERGVLRRHMAVQIEEAIYHLFTWSRGSFFFEADKRPDEGETLLSLNAQNLLLEGARRVDEWSLVEKKIPSFEMVFALDPERAESAEVELTEDQRQVVALLDGRRSLQQILESTPLGEFEIGKAVYGLLQAGIAHPTGQREPSPQTRVRHSEVIEHRNLGIAFYRTGLHADARREFDRVLKLDADDEAARFHLALLALHEGRPLDAVRRLRDLLNALGGGRPEAFHAMAVGLARLGHHEEALLALRRAEADGTATPVVLLSAYIELGRRDPEAAEAALARLRERPGSRTPGPGYYHALALAHALRRDLPMARTALAQGLREHPDSAPLLCLAGAVAEREGELEEAARHYRQAAEEDPTLPQPHKNLGDVAYRRGHHEEAFEHFRRAVGLASSLGDDVYLKLGNIHFKRRERADALRCWSRALELNPENDVARKNLEVASHAG